MRLLAVWFGLLLVCGCATNPVKMRTVAFGQLVRAHRVSAYDGREISDRTLALLDRLGRSTADHVGAIDYLAEPVEALPDRARLLARAELQYSLADRASTGAAPALFLAAARDALAALCSNATEGAAPAVDPLRAAALEAHGYALTRFLAACTATTSDAPALLGRLRDEFDLELVWDRSGPWQLDDFDRFVCADTLAFTGLRHRYRRLGAGVPLILQRDPASGIPAYLTPEAVVRAMTAVLQTPVESGVVGSTLRFVDPRVVADVELGPGVRVPLAADFTAPFGYLLAQANLHEIESRSFFESDADGHEGLFLLEDYDAERRPVVMVHGLWSSPLTWRDLTNDVFGDPSLHRHYQVWHYFYATGTPLLENARQLRETLTRARRDLDPDGDDFATRELILVGHSMGGLLSRIVLTSSGDRIWDTLFEERYDDVELTLEDHDRELARGLYFWEPLPFVDRAIFIAAPHRGSALADSWIGRLGSSLMFIPDRLRGLVDRIRGRSGVRVEVPTSVDELSGDHPVMRALADLPMREDVVYHSIMGNVSESDDPAEWTDSIVPYHSSRLAGAASELVIPRADHGVHFDPRASAEVRRILRAARFGVR